MYWIFFGTHDHNFSIYAIQRKKMHQRKMQLRKIAKERCNKGRWNAEMKFGYIFFEMCEIAIRSYLIIMIMFCLFWRFFSVVIFVDAPKKGGILYSLMYLWYILIFQYLIVSFTQTLRYWSAPFTPILSPLHPSDTEDRVQVGEKEKGILILYVQDIFRTHVIIHS